MIINEQKSCQNIIVDRAISKRREAVLRTGQRVFMERDNMIGDQIIPMNISLFHIDYVRKGIEAKKQLEDDKNNKKFFDHGI